MKVEKVLEIIEEKMKITMRMKKKRIINIF